MPSAAIMSMDEPAATPPKRRMSNGCVVFLLVMLTGATVVFVEGWSAVSTAADQMKCSSRCRELIMAMKRWAIDHNGQYPTGATSNELLRKFIRNEDFLDERIFNSPCSRYQPDGITGEPPDYNQALEPGENPWMIVDGLNLDSPGNYALIFENSLDTTWPPRWDPTTRSKPVRGRTWREDKFFSSRALILIGRNDGSTLFEYVDAKTGHLESQFQPDSPFPLPQGDLKLLDIEE